MDKNAIKKYAVWARRELIERVSQRAMIYGITAKDAGDPNAESVNGHLLTQAEKRQRQALVRNIKEKGYEQVMEEVAYTWFNRFAALRFMEVNGYLPSHIRVFTNDAGEFKPQILAEAIHLELDGLDMNRVYELESANKSEELFKYLLIVQCNALNSILPGIDRRYAIMKKGAQPQYLMSVKFLDGETPYDAFAPRENVRIKKKGGGLNFVHGGISLQEMVVPVIEYHFMRNQYSEYKKNRSKYDTKPVEIALLSANRKITNMIFSLSFYQKEPVSYNREKANYQLYFTDSAGKSVSDTVMLIADKTSDNGQERTFRCSFNLKQLKYSNTEQYYLIIADESGMIITREEFQIDIAFAVDEFDFFG